MQILSQPIQRVAGTDRYMVPQSVLIRAVAYFIDSMLFALVFAPIYVTWRGDPEQMLSGSAYSMDVLIMVGATSVYFFLWEGAVGWTPGKRLLQMRVVQADGSRCGWLAALIRNVIRPLDMFPFGLIGAVSIAAGFNRQRVGDRAAHTMVVRELPLPMVPPPYVPADRESRRCPRCGLLTDADKKTCPRCGYDMDKPLPWPFGPAPGASRGPAAGPGWPGQGAQDEGTHGEPDEGAHGAQGGDSCAPVEGDESGRVAQQDSDRAAGEEGAAAGEAEAEDDGRARSGEQFLDLEPGEMELDEVEYPPPGQGPGGRAAPEGHPSRSGHTARAGSVSQGKAPRRPTMAGHYAPELFSDDDDTRLLAAREVLLDGDRHQVRELASVAQTWEHADKQFVTAISRTLDGWRPVVVLEALRNDADDGIAAAAKEGLATVNERTRKLDEERREYGEPRDGERAPAADDDAVEDSAADNEADDDKGTPGA